MSGAGGFPYGTGGAGDAPPTLAPRRGRGPLLYAERPRRRWRQLLADVTVAAWVVVVALLAVGLHDLVLALQAPAQGLADAGGRVRDAFAGAAGVAADVPFVGDRLAGALSGGTESGQRLVAAGEAQREAVATAATTTAWLLVFVLLVPVVPWWLTLRARWVMRAREMLALRDGHADADLLALRALTRGSPARLARRVPDAADGWRRADPATLMRLAEMELGRLGLRPGQTVHTRRSGPHREIG